MDSDRATTRDVDASGEAAPGQESGGNPVWGFWGTLVWGLLIGLIFLLVQSAVMGIYVNLAVTNGSEAETRVLYERAVSDGDILSWATVASAFVCTILVGLAVVFKQGSNLKRYLGLHLVGGKQAVKWSLLFIALLIVLDLITAFLDRPVTPDVMQEIYASADSKFLLFFGTVVAASVFEELFFRGFLMEGFRRTFLGPWGSVLVTAAFWSLVHVQYDVYGIVTIFAIGLFFGVVKIKSGSTLFAMALHALNNGIAFFFLVLLSRMEG